MTTTIRMTTTATMAMSVKHHNRSSSQIIIGVAIFVIVLHQIGIVIIDMRYVHLFTHARAYY